MLNYLVESQEFAVYPEAGTGSPLAKAYCALGLVGETGELEYALFDSDNVLSEAGDVCWYIAQLCREFDIRPASAAHDLTAMPLHMLASRIAELVKKELRDGSDGARRWSIASHLGAMVEVLTLIAAEHGTSLSQVEQDNLDKLRSRRDRNVLHGSGDHR